MSKHSEPVLAGCYLRDDTGKKRSEHYCELTCTRLLIYDKRRRQEEEVKLENITRVRTRTSWRQRPFLIGGALLLMAWFLSQNFQWIYHKPVYTYNASRHDVGYDPDRASYERADYKASLQQWEERRDQTTWILFALAAVFFLSGLRRRVFLIVYAKGNMLEWRVYNKTRQFLNFYQLLRHQHHRVLTT